MILLILFLFLLHFFHGNQATGINCILDLSNLYILGCPGFNLVSGTIDIAIGGSFKTPLLACFPELEYNDGGSIGVALLCAETNGVINITGAVQCLAGYGINVPGSPLTYADIITSILNPLLIAGFNKFVAGGIQLCTICVP